MASTPRSGSNAPTFLITLALIAAVAYLVFFRGGSGDIPLTPATEPPVKILAQPVEVKTPPTEPATPQTPVATATPAPQEPHPLRSFRDHASAGAWREARTEIASLFTAEIADPIRTELAAKGIEINERLFSTIDPQDVETYEIQPGDSLIRVAQKFKHLKYAFGPILLLNAMRDPNATLRLGRKLRIPKGGWSIVVDKSLFKLFLCYEGAPYKSFTVTIGTDLKTPAGEFKIGPNKNPKPPWYPPQEMLPELRKAGTPIPIPYGHPQNPLGEYWIPLDHDTHQGLGIHGTNDPKSLGTKASNGCVRMDNVEVMLIAWSTYPGMTVTIVE